MPCLPVDSATSCSSHRPKPGSDRIDHERELVAAGLRERAQGAPQPRHAGRARSARPERGAVGVDVDGPGAAAPSSSARTSTPISAAGTMPNADSARVAPADVRVAGERPPEAVLVRQLLEARAGVGDRHEVGAVLGERPEVREQRQRLDRAAGLGGDDEQRALRVDRALHRARSSPRRSSRARAAAAPPRLRTKQRRSTSGASEEPPMPSSTTSSQAVRAHLLARTPRDRPRRSSMRSAIVSQPRRLATSGVPAGPHSVASGGRSAAGSRRSVTLACAACASFACTAGFSDAGISASTVKRPAVAHATIVVAASLLYVPDRIECPPVRASRTSSANHT